MSNDCDQGATVMVSDHTVLRVQNEIEATDSGRVVFDEERWRSLPMPLVVFRAGTTTTLRAARSAALTSITASLQRRSNRTDTPSCAVSLIAAHLINGLGLRSVSGERPGTPSQMTPLSERQRGLVVLLVLLGVILAGVGLVVGLSMALKTTPVPCSGGAHGFGCSAHLHAGEGTAIAVLSVMVGIVIVLVGVIAQAMPAKRSSRIPW